MPRKIHRTEITGAKFHNCSGQNLVFHRLVKNPHLKARLIQVDFNNDLAESPFSAVADFAPQTVDLLRRSQRTALNNF